MRALTKAPLNAQEVNASDINTNINDLINEVADSLIERLELLIFETKSGHDVLYDEILKISKKLLSTNTITLEKLDILIWNNGSYVIVIFIFKVIVFIIFIVTVIIIIFDIIDVMITNNIVINNIFILNQTTTTVTTSTKKTTTTTTRTTTNILTSQLMSINYS